MSSFIESKNDKAWKALFEKYDILSHVKSDGQFIISAAQIKEYREPRLMAKFDHRINLPKICTKNNLDILPVSRGDYVISHFTAYQPFEVLDKSITRASLPDNLQSLDANTVSSETIAINCAFASGILADFLEEDMRRLYPTVSGRMGSGCFDFFIQNSATNSDTKISVNNSQIEIDAAFEGPRTLSLIEAKRDLAEDFLIRQLYYPYRVWSSRVTKKVRPIFLVYSNGIFNLYEYEFEELTFYNSLKLIKHKNYSIEDTAIAISDLQEIALHASIVAEPEIPFPQANNFERVINICELLNTKELSREQVTEQYAFDSRQTNYYTDAARYLGVLERKDEKDRTIYALSPLGKHIMKLNYKKRQLAFCKLILQHRPFKEIFSQCMETGVMPNTETIVSIMQRASLYNINSLSTYNRRSSTISGWINWMLSLIKE